MRIKKSVSVVAVAAAASMALTACGGLGSSDGSSGSSDTIKVGFVSAQTGSLAGFGETDKFVVDQMKSYFADNPISVDGKDYKVDIILKDAQSDSSRAADVATDLINNEGVDVVLSTGTPDIVNPVSDQCEANATPCITTVAPWQPYYYGRGGTDDKGFTWTYHFFWGLEDVAATYEDMWNQVETNKKVGGLFPNDADGQAWADKKTGVPAMVSEGGYTVNNPGLYTNGSQDFSAQISSFKSDDDEILTGVPIPPDFTTFWKQAMQQGYHPKIATIGKALLFPSSVEALGDSGNNLGTEVWWTPTYPFKSSLTGQSAAELAQSYEDGTGKQWTQPLGFSEALFEVMTAAVEKAGSTDKQAIADALSTLKVDTVVGDLDWTSGPVPNVAKTPLAGGQWRKSSGKYPYDLVIVDNKTAPEIPVASKVQPLSY